MTGGKNTQQRIVNLPIAIRVNGDSFRNNPFDLVGHDAKMPAVTSRKPELWLVFEYVEPETQGMVANPDDVLLKDRVRTTEPRISLLAVIDIATILALSELADRTIDDQRRSRILALPAHVVFLIPTDRKYR